jgi:hypothetical protein
MNFRKGRPREDLEINLIPFIDVLLVIVIFLMVTTTYSKFTALQVTLPTADAQKALEQPFEINIAIDASGRYAINKRIPARCAGAVRGNAGRRWQRQPARPGHHQCRRAGHAPDRGQRDGGGAPGGVSQADLRGAVQQQVTIHRFCRWRHGLAPASRFS